MPRHVLLSHGLESGPDASKVSAMAEVATARGFVPRRMDYRDLGAATDLSSVEARVARLLDAARACDSPPVLAGSSMGAFSSARVSLAVRCAGLFLLAPPPFLAGVLLDCGTQPTAIVHGWHDELIPASVVVAFAHERSLPLHLVDDSHRLTGHVDVIAQWFGLFLDTLPR